MRKFSRVVPGFKVQFGTNNLERILSVSKWPPLLFLSFASPLTYEHSLGKVHTCSHTLPQHTPYTSAPPSLPVLPAHWQQQREILGGRKRESVCVHKLSSHGAHYSLRFCPSMMTPLAATHGSFIPNQQSPWGKASKWLIRYRLVASRWLRPSGAQTVWGYVCCSKPYMTYVLDVMIGGVRYCSSPFFKQLSFVGVPVPWETAPLYRKLCFCRWLWKEEDEPVKSKFRFKHLDQLEPLFFNQPYSAEVSVKETVISLVSNMKLLLEVCFKVCYE